MSTKQPADNLPNESASTPERTVDELYAELDRTIRQMDQVVHEQLSAEAIAEWEEIMRDYEEGLAEEQREAEEAKLQSEIDDWMDRLNADIDRLTRLSPADLEFDETLTQTFASWNEVDALMHLRCRHYPDKLAKWESEVMAPMRRWEGIVAAAREEEESKPGN